jgi:hypothetical protein
MFRFSRRSYAIVAVLLLSVGGDVFAQQPSVPAGNWNGVIRSAGASARVDATFKPKLVTLHFPEPFNCTVNANFLKADKDGSHYTLKPPPNGGQFCEELYPNAVLVITPSATTLSLSLNNPKTKWTGRLTPTQPTH